MTHLYARPKVGAWCLFLHDIFLLFSPWARYVIVHVAMFGNSLQNKQARTHDSSPSTRLKMNDTRASSPGLSSHGEHVDEDHGGDYSTRMEELFDGDEEEHGNDEEEEEFLYDGVDARQVTRTNYREQLRDVLGPDDTSDVFEEEEIERSLLREDPSEKFGDADAEAVSTAYCLVLMGCS